MIATNIAMRSEEVFIASITTACDADSLVQFGKSNTPVTFPNCRSALSKRSSLNDQLRPRAVDRIRDDESCSKDGSGAIHRKASFCLPVGCILRLQTWKRKEASPGEKPRSEIRFWFYLVEAESVRKQRGIDTVSGSPDE